jgi:alpha-galactosidase
VQDAAEPDGPRCDTWGVSLAWSGSWHIEAQADAGGLVRVRAGRVLHEGEIRLGPGERLVTPPVLLAYSPEGLGGLARVWHAYERLGSAARDEGRYEGGAARPRLVAYNSWEATEFDVEQDGQLELARIAASVGAELFVVDDGWFTGRSDDTGGLGDWEPDPAAFPDGFGAFVDSVRALGLEFGLWVEPESVSPKSKLYAEHPDWVYAIDGRPGTLIRNQLLLDLGREDVFEFVRSTFDRLLTDYPISYLKWDMNRPPTERGRPSEPPPRAVDLDAAHVANYYRLLDHLRAAYPHLTVEGCAGGGARVDAATIARTDLVWPSDNTGPQDRLAIQHGFLHAHAPHLMSSWVTDSVGYFDTRPRSLRFRFVLAMAGVLGIGADIRAWSAAQREEAARWVALYKELRETIHHGEAHLIGDPADRSCAVQYSAPDGTRTLVLAWNSSTLIGVPRLPGRPDRLRLQGLDRAARYVDEASGRSYSGAHLEYAGLPVAWTAEYDADVIVLVPVEQHSPAQKYS